MRAPQRPGLRERARQVAVSARASLPPRQPGAGNPPPSAHLTSFMAAGGRRGGPSAGSGGRPGVGSGERRAPRREGSEARTVRRPPPSRPRRLWRQEAVAADRDEWAEAPRRAGRKGRCLAAAGRESGARAGGDGGGEGGLRRRRCAGRLSFSHLGCFSPKRIFKSSSF